ncbi:hypothetical protein MMC2321_01954 [Chitinophaga sp. MM2321]
MRISNYIIAITLFACSCASEKKLAQKCADRFPVKSETVYVAGESRYDTAYIAGNTMILQDTVRVECDSAKQVITKYVYLSAKCPDSKMITVHTTDTLRISKEDTAKTTYLQLQVDVLTSKNEVQRKAILWLSAGCLVLLAWTFRNPIISMAKKILT